MVSQLKARESAVSNLDRILLTLEQNDTDLAALFEAVVELEQSSSKAEFA
jgi:hypothetical protein